MNEEIINTFKDIPIECVLENIALSIINRALEPDVLTKPDLCKMTKRTCQIYWDEDLSLDVFRLCDACWDLYNLEQKGLVIDDDAILKYLLEQGASYGY